MKPFTKITILAFLICFIVGLQEFHFHYEKYVDLSIYAVVCFLVLFILSAKQLLKEIKD